MYVYQVLYIHSRNSICVFYYIHVYTHCIKCVYIYTHNHVFTHVHIPIHRHTQNAHIHIQTHVHTCILKGNRILSSSKNARKDRERGLENEHSDHVKIIPQNYSTMRSAIDSCKHLTAVSQDTAYTSLHQHRTQLPITMTTACHCCWNWVLSTVALIPELTILPCDWVIG